MKRGFLFVVLAGVLWGTSGIFVRRMSSYGFDTWQTTALRISGAFLVMLVYCFICRRSALKLNAKEFLLYLGSGASLFGTSGFYFAAIQQTSISTAVVLMYIAPVPVMLFSVAFLGEKMTISKLSATACMLVGCALVSGVMDGFRVSLLGILFGVLSGLSYAAYNIFTKVQMRCECEPLSATLYTFLFAGLLAFCICKPWQMPIHQGADALGVTLTVVLLALVTCVLPYLLYTLALKSIPVGTASALSIVEPMSASLVGLLVYSEPLSIFSICGIVLILFSVLLLSRSDREKGKTKKQA